MVEKFSNNHYNKNLKERARKLRNNSTLAEVIIWNKVLKKKQLRGFSFLRQRPIGNYIVDFFCKDLNLIIELDGPIHNFNKKKDNEREKILMEMGYSIIRFQNHEVLNNLSNVQISLEYFIDDIVKQNKTVITPLSPQGEN